MAKCFLDTTILTDVLLKDGEGSQRAKAALGYFEDVQLPTYAIKEFKRGPLKNFVWMYNKFVTAGDFSAAIAALHRMSRTPRRYTTSTALEALVTAAGSIGDQTASEWAAKYGPDAEIGNILRDEMRLVLKRRIYVAWSKRRDVGTQTVHPLSCYEEREPYERRGLIELLPVDCDREPTCCLAPALRTMAGDLRKMKEAIDSSGSERLEDRKRAKALRQIYRTPKVEVTDGVCRSLGDAIFVAFAPQDATILTTNARDHKVLADAIGKQVKTPDEVTGVTAT